MKNKISVTIGIPAHNEGLKVFNLINSILNQDENNCYTEEIILIYSGEDSNIIKERLEERYKESVTLFIDKDRTSKLDKLNRISQLSKSETTLVLDADISIIDNELLDKLSKPFVENTVLITVPEIIPITPTNLLQKILFLSHESKRLVSQKWNGGDNFISAIGRSMMYRTTFFKTSILKSTLSGEDYFTYVKAKELGGSLVRINNVSVFFELPRIIKDHISQSNRFLSLNSNFKNILKKESIKKYGTLPLILKIKIFITMLHKNPIHTALYILLLVSSKMNSIIRPAKNSLWEISESTKNN